MKISENISLREFNSFGVEARAARLVEWETSGELAEISFEGRWMALGGGNNILFTKDFDGTLIKSAAKHIEITTETAETVSVRADAGVDWGEFTEWCVARCLWGVENLSGIPGTVGAAPIQNIGAYGAEVKDVVASVECFVVGTGNFLTLAAEHCGFGYRDSVFKRSLRGKVIVTAVNFVLSKVPRPNLTYAALAEKVSATSLRGGTPVPTRQSRKELDCFPLHEVRGRNDEEANSCDGVAGLAAIARAVVEIRNSKLPDPRKSGNAGSFFKNPVVETSVAQKLAKQYPGMPLYPAAEPGKSKLAAGWLIEQAGWKGRTEGHVGIHPKQALIVVNLGGATGREIADFARSVQDDVRAKFGVDLETEVNII